MTHRRVSSLVVLSLFLGLTVTARCTAAEHIADPRAMNSHLFKYEPKTGENPRHVNLAGDFNGWSSTATELNKVGDAFQIDLKMEDGVHYYKFIVDGRWTNDPASDTELEVGDNYGGKNSAVMIGLDGRKLPVAMENQINSKAISFQLTDVRDCNVASSSLLRLSLRTQTNGVNSVAVLTKIGDDWKPSQLFKAQSEMGYDRYGTLVTTDQPEVHFIFKVTNGTAVRYIANGMAYDSDTEAKAVAYSVPMKTDFETPDWAKHAVWYQIFPERFRNGDSANDPPNTLAWNSKWFSKLPGEKGEMYHDVWARRFGGDIQGIREKLPYLRELGITAIYLNPIFQAEDMHKYDTSDYRHVDEHFGFAGDIEALQGETEDPATWQWTKSDKLFLDFLADAHKQGFKVIIDGVFNHVGRKFWAFQDVIKNGKDSKFASWFDIIDWTPSEDAPFHYHAWDRDNGALPALKKDADLGIAHGPREHIIAITKRWLAPDGDATKGVDGFRLDAPEGITHPFWREWRTIVKGVKPDAYIDGEIWNWAQPWLSGGEYDAVMNYRFATTAQDYFVNQKRGISETQFNNRCNEMIFNYPLQAVLANQNLFDSHDTDRFASMFVNPDRPFDGANRIEDNGPDYSPAKPNDQQREKMLQAVTWQMTFAGAPMIYYGDEAGMWSPDDPSNRQPMIWKDLPANEDPEVQFDQGKFEWYQRLIAIRRSQPALQTGFFRPVLIDDAKHVFVYARDLGDAHVFVVLNHSGAEQTILFEPGTNNVQPFTNLLTGDIKSNESDRPELTGGKNYSAINGIVRIHLNAWGSAVLSETN